MLNELNQFDPQAKLAVLLRHADRDRIPSGEIGNDIPLNAMGIANAVRFGEALQRKPVSRILTSPVLRCVQTAECISEGLGKQPAIIPHQALGAPGLHISDDQLAGQFYLEHGFQTMYTRFVRNEKIPGVTEVALLKTRMEEFIRQETRGPGITLFISHDSLVTFYAFARSGTVYSFRNWLKYLTGIIQHVE